MKSQYVAKFLTWNWHEEQSKKKMKLKQGNDYLMLHQCLRKVGEKLKKNSDEIIMFTRDNYPIYNDDDYIKLILKKETPAVVIKPYERNSVPDEVKKIQSMESRSSANINSFNSVSSSSQDFYMDLSRKEVEEYKCNDCRRSFGKGDRIHLLIWDKDPRVICCQNCVHQYPKVPTYSVSYEYFLENIDLMGIKRVCILRQQARPQILITQADINLIEEKRQFVEDMMKKLNHFNPKKRDIYSIIFSYPHATQNQLSKIILKKYDS